MTEDLKKLIFKIGNDAKSAVQKLARIDSATKKRAIKAAAMTIKDATSEIISANLLDLENAKQKGLSESNIDRLMLNEERINSIVTSLETIADMDDPVGKTLDSWDRPNGMKISKVTVPLGVIGIIYESRPNVTADAGILCLKSGNAVILRGGSEAVHSNQAILIAMMKGLVTSGIPEKAIQLIPTQDRSAVEMMLKDMVSFIDVIIPRGGKSLIASVQENAKVPVMGHLEGICHTYVHSDAELEMSVSIILNAKMRRTGICGATETVLIHQDVIASHAPAITRSLMEAGCEVRADKKIAPYADGCQIASESDWGKEFLSPIIAIKSVDSIEEAVDHICQFGSGHTECIISSSKECAEVFFNNIDSAILMHNVSTQFADGGEFGLGAEIGIATGKIHARGPVGAAQLVSYKYQVSGSGQIRP